MANWTANKIRAQFLEFFKEKEHVIVPSAPMVVKDDPTLMFTNAGMNPFKDIFLNNRPAANKRIADTQKCLRVSGKHNDLEEVGIDTYHHTMFEMLGNWSFGDYFKEEAITWAWELLTNVYGIDKDRLYVTVFEGDKSENLDRDDEAANIWARYTSQERIINGNKNDNFWEMGDIGPCGPCSEIHVDIRPEDDRRRVDGRTLVNQDHPQVVEIWNLVFMQFNRKADRSLEPLPAKHIDTGMGFERLCMVLQNVQSNYDTDVFTPFLSHIEKLSGKTYGQDKMIDIAMRVIADHVRAVSFAIADGQLPSNTGAGYVIRRILRRAIRYGYSFLDIKEAFIYKLVVSMAASMGGQFPELKAQQGLIEKVIKEEEKSFLHTLESGLKRFANLDISGKRIEGKQAFELYDTYGFPIDLTRLIAAEKGFSIDEAGFEKAMQAQKDRSREDSKVETADWIFLDEKANSKFVGYDQLVIPAKIIRYRTLKQKGKDVYQLVLDKTPFYAESGGQVGDKGVLDFGDEEIQIYDTKKENDLILHFANKLPNNLSTAFTANVRSAHRLPTIKNHSATHLLHAALRQVLGNHVEQKGSLVAPDKLRFDFSHFSKMTNEELPKVEQIVNEKILENIPKGEDRTVPFQDALDRGAMALFGEKYGDNVRVITFDPSFSVELCGGVHVGATGEIGLFKIVSENGIAAGVRRIEAITGATAKAYYDEQLGVVQQLEELVNNPLDPIKSVKTLLDENHELKAQIQSFIQAQTKDVKGDLLQRVEDISGIPFIGAKIELADSAAIKNLIFDLAKSLDNHFIILGATIDGKPQLSVSIAENLVNEKDLHAGNIIRELAKDIKGGGGGQPFYATAGGADASGIESAIKKARELLIKN